MTRLPQRPFGSSGLHTSALGLGTYHLTSDRRVPHAEALRIVGFAADQGVGLVDTAPLYGLGEAELIVGRALASRNGVRPLVMGKIGRFEKSILMRLGDACYRDVAAMRAQFEHSLRLLGMRRLDVLLVHETDWPQWWDAPDATTGPVLDFLVDVKAAGLVSHVGISARKPERAAQLCRSGLFDVLLFVHYYNMVWQEAGDIAIEAATAAGMAVAVGAPYRQGLLTAVDPTLPERLRAERRADVPPGIVDRIAAAQRIARSAGMSMTELGLRWLAGDDRVHCTVVGPRSVAELAENLRWASAGPLDDDVRCALGRLRGIAPGQWDG
jgi:aryl-alcohol dehydrogenase-like predicted oxidoreductase